MRLSRSLGGTWQFQLDPAGSLGVKTVSPDREITVPLPWQTAFPELEPYSGYAWYRRSFDLDADWLGGELLLQFGAVDYWCQVFVNGQLVGEHEGGYTPFRFSIRDHVHAGANDLAVRVYDVAQTHIDIPRWSDYSPAPQAGPPFDANNIPHGKQEWYINVGGIWQDVTLTAVPKTFIEQVHVIPDIAGAQARITIALGGDSSQFENAALQLAIEGQGTAVTLTTPGQVSEARIGIENPRLWNLADPHLYRATIRLHTQNGDDELDLRFGMREITTRDGQLLLNGEPIFLLAALDQDLYPDTIYTVPSVEFLRDEFRKARELGLNCLRCHIKPPDPRYLELADEMGLLVWAEIPSWRTFYSKGTVHTDQLRLDDAIKQRAVQTLREMIARDMNHPCIIIWTIVNEDWGTSLPLSADDRAWVAEMYDLCKKLDPTRLVVDNSACLHAWGPNIHVKSDLDDFHIYANIPDQARSFEQSIEEFNLRPLWSWSNHGDAQRRGDEPLILSEFGNWGLPSLTLLREHYRGDPRWFDLGPWWSQWEGEPGWARGVEERFHKFGLDSIWSDYEAFATATQWHEFAALKFEIETLRRQPSLAGYVITELADTYWESNGLLDFARNPKVFHRAFTSVNSADMLVPEPQHYASWDDDLLGIRVHGSHFGNQDWSRACLQWAMESAGVRGEREIAPQACGAVHILDERLWKLPRVAAPQTLQFQFTLAGAEGQPLAHNALDILILPAYARRANYTRPVAVFAAENVGGSDMGGLSGLAIQDMDSMEAPPSQGSAPDAAAPLGVARHDLATSLQRIGYQTSARLDADTEVAVTNLPTAELLHWVRDGGKLLFMSSGPGPFFWTQSRSGAYSGNWMTSFTWLRPGIYKRLPVANPIGLPFRHVMPLRTIVGLPVEDPAVQPDLLAGMISGWLRHPATHTVQFRYGRGRVVMTTFTFEESLQNRPAAIALFHDLLDHLVSDACDPTLKANY